MTSTLPASVHSASAARAAELRGWALGLRDLRNDSRRGARTAPGTRSPIRGPNRRTWLELS